jgi:hypothetical protein
MAATCYLLFKAKVEGEAKVKVTAEGKVLAFDSCPT